MGLAKIVHLSANLEVRRIISFCGLFVFLFILKSVVFLPGPSSFQNRGPQKKVLTPKLALFDSFLPRELIY
jgi:hypothetical protein